MIKLPIFKSELKQLIEAGFSLRYETDSLERLFEGLQSCLSNEIEVTESRRMFEDIYITYGPYVESKAKFVVFTRTKGDRMYIRN